VGGLEEFQHRTAETLVGLLIRARRRIRIFAPFLDESALAAIAPGISAASNRGVLIDLATRASTESVVLRVLAPLVEESGDNTMLSIRVLPTDETFPHLKLVSIDGKWAYVGSANLTWAALVHNVELGVLVEGAEVEVLERLYDELFRDPEGNRPSEKDGFE
jgi:phosphatidylserine/phosphatidylglycerophosphate/cardiolipin synthase-like enzyme